MSQLPVAIRRDIRDSFQADNSDVQKAFNELKEIIGYPVICDPDWPQLWTICEDHFEDKSTFIPHVVGQITPLIDALKQKLDDETSTWTEKFLEKIEPRNNVIIALEAHDIQQSSVKMLDNSALLLSFPTKPSYSASSTAKLFSDLDNLFIPKRRPLSTQFPSRASAPSAAANGDDEDSDFEPILTPTSTFSLASHSLLPQQPYPSSIPSKIPTLSSLPRPDILFPSLPPYILHIRQERNRQHLSQTPSSTHLQYLLDRIIIQATHEPSLKLIHAYFSKWTRSDTQTREKVPVLRYTLLNSCLGPGMSVDTLVIEPFSQVTGRSGGGVMLNAAVYLSFVEGVLGYQEVGGGRAGRDQDGVWEYRRTVRFDG